MSPTHGRAGAIMPRYVAPAVGGYSAAIAAVSGIARRYKCDDLSTGAGALTEASGGVAGDIGCVPGGTGSNTTVLTGQTGIISDGGKSIQSITPATSSDNPIAVWLTTVNNGVTNAFSTAGSLIVWYSWLTSSGTDVIFRDNSSSGGSLLNLISTPTFRWQGTDHTLSGTLASWKTNAVKHMFVFTTDGTNCKVYLDGSLNTSWTQSAPFSGWGNFITFGRNGGVSNQYTKCQFDEIALATSAITATDVSNLWAAR